MFWTYGQKPWKIRFRDIYILILVFPIFETNQGVTIFKNPLEELINWHLPFATPIHHRSVMLMSYVIQSCSIREIGYETDAKNRVSVVRFTFHGNMSWKKSSFSYGELNVVLAIQLSCRRIKLRQMNSKLLPPNQVSYHSFRFVESCFVQWICSVYLFSIFCYGSGNFRFSTWNSPLFRSFWSSFF